MSKRQAKAVAAAIEPAAVIPRREVVTAVPEVGRPSFVRTKLAGPPRGGSGSRDPDESRTADGQRDRIHMTVSSEFLEKLEAARRGQGHVQPGATKSR